MTREEAARQIYGLILSADDEEGPCIFSDQIEALEMAIEALEQPERKKGKWIEQPDFYGFFETIPVCSECGCTTKYREKYKCCPNCGAKMEGEE